MRKDDDEMSADEIITIRLRDTAQNKGALPQIVRLRRLIKAAIRSFGFRCVSIEVKQSDEKEEKQTSIKAARKGRAKAEARATAHNAHARKRSRTPMQAIQADSPR